MNQMSTFIIDTNAAAPAWDWKVGDLLIPSQNEDPSIENVAICTALVCEDQTVRKMTARYIRRYKWDPFLTSYESKDGTRFDHRDATPLTYFGVRFERLGKMYFIKHDKHRTHLALYPDGRSRPWTDMTFDGAPIDMEALRFMSQYGFRG